jgi:hypothetical protein
MPGHARGATEALSLPNEEEGASLFEVSGFSLQIAHLPFTSGSTILFPEIRLIEAGLACR